MLLRPWQPPGAGLLLTVLAHRDLDLLVVVSPSAPCARRCEQLLGRRSDFRLGLELRARRAAGTEVVVFEPDSSVQAVTGRDWMSRDRVDDITRAAFAAAPAQTGHCGVRQVFAGADQRPPDGSVRPIPPRGA